MEAMRHVEKRAICLVVGDGPALPAVEKYVRENDLAENVRFLGWRQDSDAIIANLDIVVQPSLWEEACSLSIMEAMAAGKALVVTESGGNSELVENTRSGLVVPKSAPQELADAINTLVRSKALRTTYGDEARARHELLFNVSVMTENTEKAYMRVVETRR
jgi:glycosyltransferase involved in cell wall biosynthesis